MAGDEGDVFVDPDGSITPKRGDVATTLSARAGAYSMVTLGPDLLLMKRMGTGVSRVSLTGEIVERGTLLELLQFIATAGWTGEFVVFDDEVRRSILFEAGMVILATSNAPIERLGEVLYRHGAITKQQFDEAVRQLGPSRRLGDIVVQRGWIKPNDLYAMLQLQVQEIFFNALAMTKGAFLFSRGIDAASVPVRVNLPVANLLMEGVQRIDELAYFRERIPDVKVIPVAVPGKSAKGDPLAQKVLTFIDGMRSLEEIARVSGLGEFEATKALFALLQSGGVQLKKASAAKEMLREQVEGFNKVLRDVHSTVDNANVGSEARATLGMFLQGGGAFDVLFANAGPQPDGCFDVNVLMANLLHLHTDDPARVVQQALHDYVAFALFAAGSVLRREDHQNLARRVQEQLTQMRTK